MQALIERHAGGTTEHHRTLIIDIPAEDDLSRYEVALRLKVFIAMIP